MQLARVVGNIVATVKHRQLDGHKLLLIQPLSSRGKTVRPLIALDAVGAGPGETVYYCRGREASFPWLPNDVPTDAAIIGIADPVSNSRLLGRFTSASKPGGRRT
jgi:microcompartment protein CcmK/EutM